MKGEGIMIVKFNLFVVVFVLMKNWMIVLVVVVGSFELMLIELVKICLLQINVCVNCFNMYIVEVCE